MFKTKSPYSTGVKNDMGDALLNWDESLKRWRGMYRGKSLSISAKKLGGTNATDTKVQANRWYRERKAEIDAELGEKVRRHEAEHKRELESIRETCRKLLPMTNDPKLKRLMNSLHVKEREIEKKLKKRSLTPLEGSLQNSLNVSVREIEAEAEKTAYQQVLPTRPRDMDRLQSLLERMDEDYQGQYELYDNKELKTQLQVRFHVANTSLHADEPERDRDGLGIPVVSMEEIAAILPPESDAKAWREKAIQTLVLLERITPIRQSISMSEMLKTCLTHNTIQEVGGLSDDYERGLLCQKLNLDGCIVPAERELTKHIEDYIRVQERMVQQRVFGEGELEQKKIRIRQFQRWAAETGIHDVDGLMNVQCVTLYFDFLMERMKKGEIGSSHVKKLFHSVKHFTNHLVSEEILTPAPSWLNRKDSRHKIVIDTTPPETIPHEHLRILYREAPEELKLFILLALNCGCGASEIGKIKEREYDSVQGRITRRRAKTKHHASAPVVCYRLWDRTREMLNRQLDKQKNYQRLEGYGQVLLFNAKGQPFWRDAEREGKYNKTDAIGKMFGKLVAKLQKHDERFLKYTFYQFRATAASAIYNSKKFHHLQTLWLAHAPKSTAERHYTRPDDNILDECLAWLEGRLFGDLSD